MNQSKLQVEEFCKVVYVRHLREVKDNGLLVIMEWDSECDEEESNTFSDGNVSSEDDEGYQSSVEFKCIGVTKDVIYQNILSDVRDIIQAGGTVDVKLAPEPDNPHDANAIAFKCMHQGEWKKIGYVVAETSEEVLAAIQCDDIVSVQFAWVKYKLWKKNPGFYASIVITRKGEWSQQVFKSRSTFS